ncbi:hypothetical protein ACTP13_24680 [Paenibacillus peoriae]|uniref:hypothetical protein n=1 Tax=Paenibacillus peoriae TaxID=59893 RepID=UPI003F983D5F
MKNGVDKGCETMGIWHEALLGKLSRPKLLEQRCECGALRGDGWGKPYATVNGVLDVESWWGITSR